MLKNKTALSLSPLALLTLAACGGGGSTVASLNGGARKGPLESATAFLDYDNSGTWDQLTEPGDTTDGSGDYSILQSLAPTALQTATGYSLRVVTDGSTVDTSTGTVLDGITMSAPSTSSMITPVTTVIEESTMTKAEVVAALGLPVGFDPLTFDPFSASLTPAEKTTALGVEKISQKVMAAVTTFAAVAEGSGVTAALAFETALDVVVARVKTASDASTTMTVSTADVAAISASLALEYTATGGAFKALADAGTANAATFTNQAATTQAATNNVAAAITAIVSEDLAVSKDVFSVVQVMNTQAQTAATTAKTTGVATTVALADTADLNGDGIIDSIAAVQANAAPTAIALSASSISEGAASLIVGTVTTTDADNTTGFTYAIVEKVNTDFAKFTIDASTGVLTLLAQPDYENQKSYTIAVSSTDSGGKSFAESFTITVGDVSESGAFGIGSDTLTWTDYNPATSADITNTTHTATSGTKVTIGAGATSSVSGNGALLLNLTNLQNMVDGDSATVFKQPTLSFSLDEVPIGSGTATIRAKITDGTNGERTGTENEISVSVDVSYYGDGTSASITALAGGTATGSYTKGDGTTATFTVSNGDIDAFGITAGSTVTGLAPSLDVKMGDLYDAFVTGAGRADLLEAGTYHLAIETTLPLQNYANEDVTQFKGQIELVASTTKGTISGTAGNDTIVATDAAEIIVVGQGKDTIESKGGSDIIVLAAGDGSATLANTNTISDFTNGTDKFALDGLTYAQLSVDADLTTPGDTNISITATSTDAAEYLMTITGVAHGYINANDFILTTDIV